MTALQRITGATGFTPQMLYLCALEAQQKGKKELGCEVLKKIVREWDETWMTEEAKDEIRLPTIFRYPPTEKRIITVVVSSDLRIRKRMKVGVQIHPSSQSCAVNLRRVGILV